MLPTLLPGWVELARRVEWVQVELLWTRHGPTSPWPRWMVERLSGERPNQLLRQVRALAPGACAPRTATRVGQCGCSGASSSAAVPVGRVEHLLDFPHLYLGQCMRTEIVQFNSLHRFCPLTIALRASEAPSAAPRPLALHLVRQSATRLGIGDYILTTSTHNRLSSTVIRSTPHAFNGAVFAAKPTSPQRSLHD